MTRRARGASAAWTAGLIACATVALVGIAWFMAQIHRDWSPGPAASDAARPGDGSAESRTDAAESSTPGSAAPLGGALLPLDRAAEQLRSRSLTIPVSGLRPSDLPPSSFSQTRGVRVHEALDIMAPAGTPVVAVEDGTVAKLFDSEAGGLTVYHFDPSRSVAYYYAHLQKYAEGLADGARVTRGQVIGYVGTTGNANVDAPHLHFAIFVLGPERKWWEGTPVDPALVLK